MNQMIEAVVTIALAITGIAMIAVLVSGRAQTSQVIGTSGHAFAESLTAAEGPVLGGNAEFPGMTSYY